jgi:hypothetical protein
MSKSCLISWDKNALDNIINPQNLTVGEDISLVEFHIDVRQSSNESGAEGALHGCLIILLVACCPLC